MFTRKDYINNSTEPDAFARYYGEIIDAAGGPEAFRASLPRPIEDIRAALDAGDRHLNTIALHAWDGRARPLPAAAVEALRARGDSPSLGSAVCILKEAARRLASA